MSAKAVAKVADAEVLETLVREVLARVRARRRLTVETIGEGIDRLRELPADQLADTMRALYRQVVEAWTQSLYKTGPYEEILEEVKPLNDRQWVLTLADSPPGPPQLGPRELRAQLSEVLIDAHHLVEERWFELFMDAFAVIDPPWTTPEQMLAIAIPQQRHNRNMRHVAELLGMQGPKVEGISELSRVGTLLERRIVDADAYNELDNTERAAVRLVISPGKTKASELLQAYIDIYNNSFPDFGEQAEVALRRPLQQLKDAGL